jgi:hypothetical protein
VATVYNRVQLLGFPALRTQEPFRGVMGTFWKLFRTPAALYRADKVADGCCFVSDIPPCTNYSGGIFIDHMLQALDGHVRNAFIVLNPHLQPQMSSIVDGMELMTVEKPAESHSAEESASEIRAIEAYSEQHVSAAIFPSLLEFAGRKKTEAFWVLLEGQTMIRLAHQLIHATSLPVIVQVMDPPPNWFTAHNVDEVTQAELFEQYETVLRSAACCACASWAMADAYSEQFLVRCTPVIPSLPAASGKPACVGPKSRNTLRIGFSGQIYAMDEWERLLRVLDNMNWKIGGSRVEVHAFTELTRGTPGANKGRPVFFRGWVQSSSELIDLLNGMDLLYVPYRFSPQHSEEARLCFPSKLTTCLAAGVPVVLHGPAYSSPVLFAQKRRAAFICDTPTDEALLTTLTQAVGNPQEYRSIAENGRAAFDACLTDKVLANSLRQVLAAGPNPRRKVTLAHLTQVGSMS